MRHCIFYHSFKSCRYPYTCKHRVLRTHVLHPYCSANGTRITTVTARMVLNTRPLRQDQTYSELRPFPQQLGAQERLCGKCLDEWSHEGFINVVEILKFVKVNLVCSPTTKQVKNGSLDETAARSADSCFGFEESISHALRAAAARKYAERTIIGVKSGCQSMNVLCREISRRIHGNQLS